MNHIDLATSGWPDYELLDSGDNKKLERFGPFVLIRPETQAIWKPLHPKLWKQAAAEFKFNKDKGVWRGKNVPDQWDIAWRDGVRFSLRTTSFKHTGVFPEQAPNWEWIVGRVKALAKGMRAATESPQPLRLQVSRAS